MEEVFVLFRILLIWIVWKPCILRVTPLTPRLPSEEERLLDMLFDGYNPSARPVINSSASVEVKIQFSLLQIQELDLRSQVLTTTGLLILEWYDERLRWDPQEISLKDVVVEAKKLWRPEFASINGADGLLGEYGQFRALIQSDGLVHWEPGGVFKTVCQIDITYYPFDEQKCLLIFGAWSYHTAKMNLTNSNQKVNKDSYEENGEWEIFNTSAERKEFFFECCENQRFSNVEFTIFLRRRYTFYIMNVILPSLMTSVLLLSIFFCTPAQKVQIGVVVLLSFRIFLLNVTDSIPKTSDHIPLLGIYLTCTMAITTLSMVLTVFVLNLHHVSDRPVPYWAKKVILVYMARLVCMCSSEPEHFDSESDRGKSKSKYRVTPNSLGKAIGSQIGLLATLNGGLALGAGGKKANERQRQSFHEHGLHFRSQYTYSSDSPARDDMKKKEEEWARDWKHLAEVVDRLFFWFFLLAITITTLLLFHPLTKTYFSIWGEAGL